MQCMTPSQAGNQAHHCRFGSLINYWYYTNDTKYNDIIQQAMLHQIGENDDYMPDNQTKTEGWTLPTSHISH